MKGVCVLIVLGVFTSWASAQFLNHRPFPTFSLENMPDTEFSCRDKILGGYYADAQTECQMFHICVKVAGVGVQDFRFLCPNGTAFDQDHQICADWEDVDCDATTLYYSSDNFDLYRIGSGFESKAKKYGEDEETFSLQRAETGDARINREHQAQRVNQQKDLPVRKHKVQNNNNNNNNDNANSERDIFKGSSSSNFFNNRNGGKESDDDYDDNVNANQDRDQFQKRKIVRKQQRRPAQNEDQSQNNQQERRPAQNNNNNQEQQERRPVQRRPVQQQENFNRRPNNQQNEQISRRPQNNQQQNNRRPVNSQSEDNFDSRRTQNNDEDVEAQTYRPHRPTGFINNFAGSSFVPTTSRPVSTTLNNDQYTTAVNNYNQRNHNNNQRSRNNENSPTPTYTISTPAPFRQTQQYNNPPSRQNNNGQYTTPSSAPQKETENYPVNFPKQPYQQQSTPQKVNNKPTQNYPTEAPVIRNTQYNNNYESTKIKQTKATENYQTASPSTSNNFRNTQYNTQYDAQKTKATSTKQTENHPTPAPFSKNTQHYDVPKTKSAVTTKQTETYPSSPVNNNNKKSTTPVKNYEYTPTAAPSRSTNNKQQGSSTGFNNNYPSTFAPRTNAGYTQISQQTTQYKSSNNQKATTAFNGNNNQRASTPVNNNGNQQNFNSQRATTPFNNNQQNFNGNQKSTTSSNNNNGQNFNTNQQNDSTPKSTPFAQYTPTVPKISSTTPVSRSNRYDETQYDDGSYDSRYENGNGNNNRRDDEFLKTAHSQNIASSRNELAKTTKNVAPSTQRPQYESPRPFSVTSNTPKITSTATQKPLEPPRNLSNNQQNNKQGVPSSSTGKKVKDASYDYAYYDTNVGSEPEYDIDADIKKSTVKN